MLPWRATTGSGCCGRHRRRVLFWNGWTSRRFWYPTRERIPEGRGWRGEGWDSQTGGGIGGSGANLVSAPATAFAYDQGLGGTSRLILAGQMSYDQNAPAGSIATVWLP